MFIETLLFSVEALDTQMPIPPTQSCIVCGFTSRAVTRTLACQLWRFQWYVFYFAWMQNGSERNLLAGIAGLARELHFRQEKHLWIYPANLTRYLSHLSHFSNVTTLVFANLVTGVFDATSLSNCFGSFINGVRTLQIHRPVTRPTSLMQIIVLFSSAVDVQISWPRWSIADANVTLHPPLQEENGLTGTLQLHGFGEKWFGFFALLSARRLRFQKVRLQGCEFSTSSLLQSLLEAVSQSTCTLYLDGPRKRELDFELLRQPD